MTSHIPPPAPPSRRDTNRAATLAAIKAAALEQVAELGAPALSIRGVARSVGMSPAGLYRYYDGRDALLTDLLVDAYNDLADAVARASGLAVPSDAPGASSGPAGPSASAGPAIDDPASALLLAIEAYRTWAVTNPARFLLVFGTPVPGYEAPADGPTVTANRRMGEVFFTLAALAWSHGQIAPPMADQPPHGPNDSELAVLEGLRRAAPGFPVELVPRMLAGWALWHGLVTLEVTGQLHWIYPDTGSFFSAQVQAWLRGFTAGLR